MKKLSIIIPYYNTEDKIFKRLLASIAAQEEINLKEDIEVIVIDDASDKHPLYNNVFKDFDHLLNISFGRVEINGGPGVTRQIGMMNSQGEYIMFCDSDDALLQTTSLKMIIDKLNETKPDMLVCKFLEEILFKNKGTVIEHDYNDRTWMHGKIYKRDFINLHEITFRPDLRANEDGYFNVVCLAMAEKIEYLDEFVYIWKWNGESITREKSCEYSYSSFTDYILAMYYATLELNDRECEKIAEVAINVIYYIYFIFQADKKWSTSKYREDVLNAYKIYYETFKDCFNLFNEDEIKIIYKSNLDITYNNIPFVINKSFEEWLEEIGCTNPKADKKEEL